MVGGWFEPPMRVLKIKFPLDNEQILCYNKDVPRGERTTLLLHKNQSRVREILKKDFKKPLDNKQILCYNKDVRDEGDPPNEV